MKLKNIKSAKSLGNILNPLVHKVMTRNISNLSRSPNTKNDDINGSGIGLKESLSSQNFLTSITNLEYSVNFNELIENPAENDNYMLYKKYLIAKTQYNKKISEIADINNRIIQNKNEVEKCQNYLVKLKEEKQAKKTLIIDLISEKESLEEIYKLKLFSLNKKRIVDKDKIVNGQDTENSINIKHKDTTKNIKNKNNISININSIDNKNNGDDGSLVVNPFTTINIMNDDEIEIQLDDIKKSDPKKYEEQVLNIAEEFLQKKDMEMNNKLIEKIKFGYQIFNLETSSYTCIKQDNIISNFFSRASSIISQESNGKYSEVLINAFLKILIKLNNVNDEMSKTLKYLNKTYKSTKKEIKEKIKTLNKRNENLSSKKQSYENIKNEFKKFIDDNKDKVKNNQKNIIDIMDNENKPYISFLMDSNLENDLDSLGEEKKNDLCEAERKTNEKIKFQNSCDNIAKNNKIPISIKTKKLNRSKILNMKHPNNVIINYIPCENTKTNEPDIQTNTNNNNEINVNNLLINNNIKIENNNNVINKDNEENKCNDIKNSANKLKINSIKKIPIPFKSTSKICRSPTNLKREVKKNLFPVENQSTSNKYIKLTPCKSQNFTNIKKSLNKSINKSFTNIYINKIQNISQTTCYFKLSDKNEYNPLSNSEISPIKLKYFEGYLFVDKFLSKLKITRKTEIKFIGIDLTDIVDTKLCKQMENVLKIYTAYHKLKKNKDEKVDINKFIYSDEIKAIRMQYNEKIKAINCKYFNFSIIIGKRFIPKAEFIFDNFDNFNMCYNCLDTIAKINNSGKAKNN